MDNIDPSEKLPLIGCGILAKEIRFLIEKNSWNIQPHFLCSSLHVDLEKLELALSGSLSKLGDVPKAVVYGTCHPRMDSIIDKSHAVRSRGQNCVELLLGKELFNTFLSEGAFFLMEDWALGWEKVIACAFGEKPEIIREIFKAEHKFLLCIRTSCSSDFSEYARIISLKIDLPLKWYDASLDHLESVLKDIIQRSGCIIDG